MKYEHAEAFCLMLYASDDQREREFLWNSRDGVTPFMISSRVTGQMMSHVQFRLDERRPDFVPPDGMRVFVDATKELIEPSLRRYVDRCWSSPGYTAIAHYRDKQEMYDALYPDWSREGAPAVVVAFGWPKYVPHPVID